MSPAKRRFTKLYCLLGVTPTAAQAEVVRAYRLKARVLHPDKNKDPDAHEHFLQLQKAYDILKDEKRRKQYDETGCEEEESDEFGKAYEWFRTAFPKFNTQDIDEFEKEYKGSSMEEEDLTDFYHQRNGDISLLLEYIPLSRPDEIERFVHIIQRLIKDKSLKRTRNFEPSIDALRQNAEKWKKKEAREKKKQPKSEDLGQLVASLKANAAKRSKESWLDELENKYSAKQTQSAKRAKPSSSSRSSRSGNKT